MTNQNNEPEEKKLTNLSEMGEDEKNENKFHDDVQPKFTPSRPLPAPYMPKKGCAKYSNAAKHLLPFRMKNGGKNRLGIDNAGIFSLFTFSWMSKYIYQAYKKGLTLDDIPTGSDLDSCDLNSRRLESIWQKELATKGRRRAVFGVAIWKFVRTRVLISWLVFSLSCIMGFLSPTIFMRKLLEYLEDPNGSEINGVIWALALTGSELLKTMFLALYYSLSYRTALRLRAACLGMVYRKTLRLKSAGNIFSGPIVNLYALDAPKLYYMIIFGPMFIGGPIISICGLLYINYTLGPWSLLGMLVFFAYYPTQCLLSYLTGNIRFKTIHETDGRIKLMTEILSHIKLIKLYAWENWFSSRIYDVRKRELAGIEKCAYCQSAGVSLIPTVSAISGIVTFLAHVAAGGSLTAAQVFSVLVFLTKQMKTSIQVIRDGSLSLYEGLVSVKRFKAFPILAFASKQLRLALTQLHLACTSIVQGSTSTPRFKAYPIFVILVTQLKSALSNLRYGSQSYILGHIICSRFKELFVQKESVTRVSHELDSSLALAVEDGFFSWNFYTNIHMKKLKKNKREKEQLAMIREKALAVLHLINFTVRKGALIGVCGPVGSGKSSLLLACLGQLKMISGQLSRSGSCAYVSQESWLENKSVKDNILFGEKFDAEKYVNVVSGCCLNEDINFLPDGDDTEVGECGANLSGGQKQRLSLARALYSDRDIYFLDDPFSAVDPQVAAQIFENCILGALEKKTVILVTRQMQFLEKCDEILVLKQGHIVETGTYTELVSRGNEFDFTTQSNLSSPSRQKTVEESEDDVKKEVNCGVEENFAMNYILDKSVPTSPKRLASAEEQIMGTVKSYAYYAYLKAAGGYFVAFAVIMTIFLNVGSNVFSSWWLAIWIKAGSGNTTVIDPATNETMISRNINDNPQLPFYMQVYGSIIGVVVVTCIIRGLTYTKVTIRASKNLHRNLFEKVLKSPMTYFERTPIGQIQNLFSRDIDGVDCTLPEAMEMMLQNMWSVMFSILSITLVFPWFIIPLVVFACVYYFVCKIFRVAIRDLKRIENICREPVFSTVIATVQGLPTIRAFNKEEDYMSEFTKLYDKNLTILYMSSNAMRWMAVRLDLISVVISFTTSFLVIFLKGEVAPAFSGLALTCAAQICGVFQYMVRLMSENEARFISVERIQNSIEKLTPEGNTEEEVNVESNWPAEGKIEFQDVVLSYGKSLPQVLNGISLSIRGGEKIGVVGRTGAGKSSLAVALFRLVELTSGRIMIDGVNIAKVPLSVLRSRLSIIPQDPVLFRGSLRSNLDPLNQCKDSHIWEVLRKTKLSAKVKSLPKQLYTYVGEEENFSVGEKQLVCLARMLLRGSQVLILDEATASIDPETEAAIQTAIQEEFKNCTVITIAHRLSTVTSCDRVLVMDQGNVVEFDDPQVLKENSQSQFAKMLAASDV